MAARLKESLIQQQEEQQKKQELIVGMSHDLKSPLTTIRAYTEALLDGVAPNEAAQQNYRCQMVWLILGLMLGSFYAIVNGPASLDTPLPPLSLSTFRLPAFLLGAALLLGLEALKKGMEAPRAQHEI